MATNRVEVSLTAIEADGSMPLEVRKLTAFVSMQRASTDADPHATCVQLSLVIPMSLAETLVRSLYVGTADLFIELRSSARVV